MDLSIVIPTLNSGSTLNMCLESIFRERGDYQVIIVDGYSVDNTLEIAKMYDVDVYCSKFDRYRARLYGAYKAIGKYIVFLDSDHIVSKGLFKDIIDLMESGLDALKIREYFIGFNRIGRYSSIWKNIMNIVWGLEGGYPRVYKREFLLKLPKDVSISLWEDKFIYNYLASKSRVRVGWSRKHIYHIEPYNLREYIVKYYRYGKVYRSLPIEVAGEGESIILTIKIMIRLISRDYIRYLFPTLSLTILKALSFGAGLI